MNRYELELLEDVNNGKREPILTLMGFSVFAFVVLVLGGLILSGCASLTYDDLQESAKPFIVEVEPLVEIDCSNADDVVLCEKVMEDTREYHEKKQRIAEDTKRFKEVMNEYGFPVLIADKKLFYDNYLKKTRLKGTIKRSFPFFAGIYICDNDLEGWPEDFIFIHDSGDVDAMIAMGFHELGHGICERTKCFCNLDETVSEFHANQYCLKMLKEYGFDEALSKMMTDIKMMTYQNKKQYKYHKAAAELTVKTELFKEVENYLKEKTNKNKKD